MASAVGDTLDGCNALELLLHDQLGGQPQRSTQASLKQPIV